MHEYTLAIVKPDGVMKGAVEEIRQRYAAAGLMVVDDMRIRLTLEQVKEFYRDHEGRFYFEGLVLAMVSGPCHVFILKGENAVKIVRALNGATKPEEAAPGTIRRDFKSAGGPFNMVHGSDSHEAFTRESKIVKHEL